MMNSTVVLFLVLSLSIEFHTRADNRESCEASLVLADSLFKVEDFDEAYSAYLNLTQKDCSVECRIASYVGLSRTSRLKEDLDNSQKFAKVAITLIETQEEVDSILLSNAYDELSYSKALNYPQAFELLEKSLGIKQRHPLLDSFSIAYTQVAIGDLQTRTQKYEAASDSYSLALSILQSSEDSRFLADVLYKHGYALLWLARYEEALSSLDQALKINLNIRGKFHYMTSSVYDKIGYASQRSAQFDRAVEHYAYALEIRKKVKPQNHISIARSCKNLGEVYFLKMEYDKGDYTKQILNCYQQALEIFEENESVEIGGVYNNLGTVYNYMGETQKSLAAYKKSLEVRMKYLGPDHIMVAQTCISMGNALGDMKLFDEAISYSRRGRKIVLNAFGKDHPHYTLATIHLGRLYIVKQQYDSAVRLFHEALILNHATFESINLDVNPDLTGYRHLFFFYWALQRKAYCLLQMYYETDEAFYLESAYKSYQLLDDLIHVVRKNMTNSADKMVITDCENQVYGDFIKADLLLAKLHGDSRYLDSAFYHAEKSKAAILSGALFDEKAKITGNIPVALIKKEDSLKQIKNTYRSELANLSSGDSASSILKMRLFEVSRGYDSLISYFEESFHDYYRLKYRRSYLTRKQIQDCLGKSEALIEYFDSDSLMYVFTISKNSFFIDSIAIDTALNNAFEAFKKNLSPQILELDAKQAYRSFIDSSNDLYRILLKKSLTSLPKDVENIIIVPSGKYAQIPWDILITEYPDSEKELDYKALKYVYKDYLVSYGFSSSMSFEKAVSKSGISDRSLLAFAPDYGSNEDLISELKPVFRSHVTPLMYNQSEVERIANFFDGKYYRGEEATEGRFKNELSEYDLIHLALHAIVDHEDPLKSSLVFTPSETEDDDNILRVHEIFDLNINARLIVLSACETGAGKLNKGEGIMSLGRAFTYAGCPSVVISHWPVDDQSTSDLMESFYKHLSEGETKTQALNNARDEFLSSGPGLRKHPFYWGGFVVLGDPDPISEASFMESSHIVVMIILISVILIIFFVRRKLIK